MNTQASRIKSRRQEIGLTQKQLAEKIGVSRVSITHWESDPSIKIAGNNLTRLCSVLDASADFLLYGKGQRQELEPSIAHADAPQGMCPEISWVQAGQWAEVCHVELDPEEVNWYPRPPGASDQTFVLRVVGESMVPEYMPGTMIYVDPERAAETGKDVIAVMTDTGEATFKRFIEEPGSGKMLKALNPSWHNPYLPINGNCRVVGVVVADLRMR